MEALKELMTGLGDMESLLPDLNKMLTGLVPLIRAAVLAGPIVLLVLGLVYLFLPPREANHYVGFRCWWGMSSVEIWRFTQKLAGITWTAMGLVLGIIAFAGGLGYGGLSPDIMLIKALTTILWQLLLVLISIVAINLVLILLFNSRGSRRGKGKK